MRTILCIIFGLMILSLPLHAIEIRPALDSEGNITELIISKQVSTGDIITIRIGSEEIDLSVDGDGALVNKAAIKALAISKYQTAKSALVAERAAAIAAKAARDTAKNNLNLGVADGDLD